MSKGEPFPIGSTVSVRFPDGTSEIGVVLHRNGIYYKVTVPSEGISQWAPGDALTSAPSGGTPGKIKRTLIPFPSVPEADCKIRRLKNLARTLHPQGVRPRDVYRKRIVATARDAHELLSRLTTKGIFRCVRHDRVQGGTPSFYYHLIELD